VSGPLTLLAGLATASAGLLVLAGWTFGSTQLASLAAGWRLMVPSTAFGFLWAGLGLALCSVFGTVDWRMRVAVRLLALATVILPVLSLFEYATNVRLGVESWLVDFSHPPDRYAGRMSAVTASCFLLLGSGLAALTWSGRWASSLVRLTAGAALAMSWLALVAVSFDVTRLINEPRFPGMAAMTIVLLAMCSAGVLSCSRQTIARLRDANADAVLAPRLLVAAFALPMVLGRVQVALDERIDHGLSAALVTVAFAVVVTVALWRAAARMQNLHRQRQHLLEQLEERVAERTRELAAANQELKQSQEQLREADRRKDEFLATLAHELRNPLAPIRTGIEILKGETVPPSSKAQAHEVIARQLQHMVRLIDDLLDVSRITAGKLSLRQERLDFVGVVHQAVETARAAIDRAGHALTLALPPGPVMVVADETRLTQVIANLLLNACKYTPRGGRIDVTLTTDGQRLELEVRDTGIGIPAVFLPRLFEKFSQVAAPLDRADGGLGLGLALVRGIVTLHGGSVEAHSDGGDRGSRFVIHLALAPALPETPTPLRVRDPLELRPVARRILVVDDNPDNVGTLAELLRQQGHLVETAADGEAAFTAAERFRPEVVLLDIGMPKLNGYEVCRRIRGQPWGRSMRVFAQTGWGQADDRRMTEEAGFDGHMVKPLDPAVLETVLRS
jgi:signal transduction histidine kinase/CheY-like chemotaxis protein